MLLLDLNEDSISIVGMQFGRSHRATDARALRGKTSGSALPGLSLPPSPLPVARRSSLGFSFSVVVLWSARHFSLHIPRCVGGLFCGCLLFWWWPLLVFLPELGPSLHHVQLCDFGYVA